jgi:protein XagA
LTLRQGVCFMRKPSSIRSEAHLRLCCGITVFACILANLATIPEAVAGAWTRPAGESLVIFSNEFSGGSRQFDNSGRLQAANRFSKFESRTRAETGLIEGTTLVVATRIGRASNLPPDHLLTLQNLGQLERWNGIAAGIRQRLWHGDSWTTSVEVLGEVIRSKRQDELGQTLQLGLPRRQIEVRMAAGHSFELGNMPAFVDASIGYRHRSDRLPADVLAGLGFGIRPHPRLLLMAQAFGELGHKTSAVPQPASRLKLLVSAVIDVWGKHSLQVSGTITPIGRSTIAERSVAVSLWRKF